jgi:hypothetical protein
MPQDTDFPRTQPEVERWARGPNRDRLALGYMVCFMVSALERSRSGAPSDYRWIANTAKAIVSGMPSVEAQLRFEVSETTHTFESAPLKQILGELLSSRLLTLGCEHCGEPFSTPTREKASPWESGGTRKCRRCGKPFDRRFAVFRMPDDGLEWMTEWAAPLLEDHDLAIMTKTMVLGTQLLHRDGRSQFDFASDTAVKISELKELPLASNRPPSALLTGNNARQLDQVYKIVV